MLQHWICGFFGCDSKILNDPSGLANIVTCASGEGAMCTMDHQVTHKFSPEGVTVIATESRSHIVIHTWPDEGYAAIDIALSAPYASPQDVFDFLATRLDPASTTTLKLARSGKDDPDGSAPRA